MILIPLEGIQLDRLQPPGRAVDQDGIVEDPLQEKRIGMIEDRHVDFPIADQSLQVGGQIDELVESRRLFEQRRDVEVAARVQPARRV